MRRTFLCSLVFGWISLFWGAFDIFLQTIDHGVFGLNDFWHGVIAASDNILGLFLLPFFGRMSDKTNTRFGKRTPYIVVGTIISMLGFTGVCVFASLGADYFVPYIICLLVCLSAMAAYRSPGLAIVPDINIDKNRNKANAISNVVSVIFTLVSMVLLLMINEKTRSFYAFGAMMIVMTLFMLAIYCITVHEKKFLRDAQDFSKYTLAYEREERGANSVLQTEKTLQYERFAYSKAHALDVQSFAEDRFLQLASIDIALEHEFIFKRKKKKANGDDTRSEKIKSFSRDRGAFNKICILCVVFCFYMAYNALTSHLLQYANVVLQFSKNNVTTLLILVELAAILTFPIASILPNKIGRKNTIFIGLLLMVVSFGTTIFFTSASALLYLIFFVLGIGFGFFIINIYPFFLETSSSDKIGSNTGIFAVAMTVAMVLTPIISGALMTSTDALFGGGEGAGVRILFPYSFAFLAIACFLTLLIKSKRPTQTRSKFKLGDK